MFTWPYCVYCGRETLKVGVPQSKRISLLPFVFPACGAYRHLNCALYSLQVVASRTLFVASCTLFSAFRGQRSSPVLLASLAPVCCSFPFQLTFPSGSAGILITDFRSPCFHQVLWHHLIFTISSHQVSPFRLSSPILHSRKRILLRCYFEE